MPQTPDQTRDLNQFVQVTIQVTFSPAQETAVLPAAYGLYKEKRPVK